MTTATILEKQLCNTFCEAISVNPVPCGFAVSSAFSDHSGDRIGFYVIAEGDDYRLEDDGEFLSNLIATGVDFEKGQRQQLLNSVLHAANAFWDTDTYEIRTGQIQDKELSKQMISFLSALIRVRDLEFLTRDFIKSTFREDATAAIREHFIDRADIEERKPVSNKYRDYIPDIVVRPRYKGRDAAIFLSNNIVQFQEAELLFGEIEKINEQEKIAVVALLEDTDKITQISLRRFQRAQNRGLAMPVFRGDEQAAIKAIERTMNQIAA